jgi:2-haloacid dehalogenase
MDAGRPFAEAIAELSAAHPDQAEMIGYWHTRWVEMVGEAFEETVRIMRELRAAGLRTYALSNWSAETYPLTRERFPFLDELDGVVISGEVGLAKPDPAIFRELISRFDLNPGTTVFIDDWDRNVAAASDLGLIAIRFFDAEQLRHDLRALGLPLAAGEPAEAADAAAKPAEAD